MRDPATEIAPGTIRFERHMPGPIPRIWDYLTHPTIRGRWLATGPMDLKEGGKYELHFRHDELTPHAEIAPEKFSSPKGVIVRGEVVSCKFPNMLTLTWEPGGPQSKIGMVLTQLQGQIRASITIEGLESRDIQIETAAHWHAHLNVLEAKSNNVMAPPFWKRVAEYEDEYRKLFGAA